MNDSADTGLDLLVTSQPPEPATEGSVDPAMLTLFRSVIKSPDALPYTHQAETFAHVLADREVALVAGTAAGKTFAIALPILAKACTLDRARKVVFMYPTRALLADQRRVLGRVVAALGRPEDMIGEIRGGMTSAQLIRARWLFRDGARTRPLRSPDPPKARRPTGPRARRTSGRRA